MKASPKHVALYARVSTKDQEVDNQLLPMRAYAAKLGWQITGEYVDHISGGTSDRAQFKRMFTDAHQRKFDIVLFWSLDRLSREGALATLEYLNKLTSYGVDWRSHTEEYLDSCGMFREAVIAILGVIAKQERVRRSERAYAAVARLRQQGKSVGGRPTRVVDRAKMRKRRAAGLTIRQLAAEFRVGVGSVHRMLAG